MIHKKHANIPGLPGYVARIDGTIWTDLKFRGWGKNRVMYHSGRWRKLPAGGKRYRCIRVGRAITGTSKTKKYYVHELMLLAFVGPCPAGMECRHLDGDKSNCRLENLKWGTRSENQMDRVRHDGGNRGERHGMHKLTLEQVQEIKAIPRMCKGMAREAAARYGVSVLTIYGIRAGRAWTWTS